jgi:uncharacterized protein (DUF58 family)
VPEREPSFPLIPSRRSGRLDVAGHVSRRRGSGAEIAGSRPYRRGDAVRLVDWRASARLSTARASDEFVVRDRFAEDAVRVLIVVDRSPSMALFPTSLPWLHKPHVVLEAGRMILASAAAAHAQVGYAEPGPAGVSFERPGLDGRLHALVRRRLEVTPPAPATVSLDQMLELLARGSADVSPGTFTFVLSDFLTPPRAVTLRTCLARGWDVIPVVVQDPVWESSFPDAAGVMLPLADAAGARVSLVRLRPAEARARREAHEERARTLLEGFLQLGLDPVLLTEPKTSAIHGAFLSWARARASKSRARRAG